jgi:hypothetical protein
LGTIAEAGHLEEEKTVFVPKEGDEAGVHTAVVDGDVVVVVSALVVIVAVDGVEVIGEGLGACGVDVGSEGVEVGSGSVAVDQRFLIAAGELSVVVFGLFKYIRDLVHVGNGENSEPSETKTMNRIGLNGTKAIMTGINLTILGCGVHCIKVFQVSCT